MPHNHFMGQDDSMLIRNSDGTVINKFKGGDIIIASGSIGTAGTNATVTEFGDGHTNTAVITLSSVANIIGDNVSLAKGNLIYTLPGGALLVNSAFMSVGITLTTGTPTTDAPDVGIGTVIASGAIATLTTGTFENIITGQTATDIAGTATVKTAIPTAAVPFVIETGAAHTIHLNYADAWADVSDTACTISGTVIINYTFMA